MKVQDEDIKYLCKDFSERAERKITRKDLENLNLIIGNEKGTATNAYAILLGKHDYTSRIQCARFRGTERVDFPDKKEYELPEIVQLCEEKEEARQIYENTIEQKDKSIAEIRKKYNFLYLKIRILENII